MISLSRRGVRLEHERYEEIKADIIDLFEECDVHHYPLDVFDIAAQLHYRVIPYSALPELKRMQCRFLSQDGCSELVYNSSTQMYEYNIYYNDSLGIVQSRIYFTILHEIGHIRLGHLDYDTDKTDIIKESEANFYAGYIIAPPPLVGRFSCRSPRELGRRFNTSSEAADYAYDRYLKWLSCGRYYKDYEIHLLELFGVA